MRELLLECQEWKEGGAGLHCRYSILVGERELNGFFCESYGVKIVNEETGEQAFVEDVTSSPQRIDELLDLLVRNGVTPTGLEDVVADWL